MTRAGLLRPRLKVLIRARIWPAALSCLCAGPLFAADALLPAPQQNLANPIAQQSRALLSATLERPLFAPSRRAPSREAPPPILATESPPPPEPPPSVTLLGIVKNDTETRAVLRAGSADKVLHLGLGDAVGGWTITAIEQRRLTLSLNDRTATVALFENREPHAPYKPPAAPARPPRAQARR